MPGKVAITVGISNVPHTRAVFEGTVRPEGIELTCTRGYDQRASSERLLDGALGGREFSLSSLMQAIERGTRLCVLPIFLGRGFVHRSLWRRVDSGIQGPGDYGGKRVAVHRYNNSAGVWARALLVEHGVDLASIQWYAAVREPGNEKLAPGRDITYTEGGLERLAEMLEQGEVDGALERYQYTPSHLVQRVFDDYRTAEADHFRRTCIFPIYHTLVLRQPVVEERAWVVQSLLEAFREARARAPAYMSEEREQRGQLAALCAH